MKAYTVHENNIINQVNVEKCKVVLATASVV
jgi:hypothetical protein